MGADYPKLAQFKTVEQLGQRLEELGVELPMDERILTAAERSPLAQPLRFGSRTLGNRWCIHPMEGWDAQPDGRPSELTLRRWRHFGRSGAKLIWGGEAAAVRPDGRANPRQTLATPAHRPGLARLVDELRAAHREAFGTTDDLVVGLQLTHSGRFSQPEPGRRAPRLACRHPLLDAKFSLPDDPQLVLTDEQLEGLIEAFLEAARTAREAGFDFVDVKACHGYLLHELLSARARPGPFGGDLPGRARMLTTIIARVRQELPQLMVGVRLSLFDTVPYRSGREVGRPMDYAHLLPYQLGFGVAADDPLAADLSEPMWLIERLRQLGVVAVNLSCGSPYYSPHIQRPAIFPPSDGYLPPEDPLLGVARQIQAVRACKQAFADLPMVGSGYSYLQDFLPHVAQAVVRDGWVDLVGLGRMVLSYPELPADVLARGRLERKRVCRTFSDCTTAPRHGLVSGCFPLDPFYKQLPEADRLKGVKRDLRS